MVGIKQNDMKEFPKCDHLLHWRYSCCQLKNVASVKVGMKEMENAARSYWILTLSCARNSSVIYTDVISIRACPILNFLWQQPGILYLHLLSVHVQDFAPVGVRFDSRLLKGPCMKWIYFGCLWLQEPSREKGKACCVCVDTTCSLSFHSGRLSGVHPALMRCSNTQRHMYYVDSHKTWSSPDSCAPWWRNAAHFKEFSKGYRKTKTTVT